MQQWTNSQENLSFIVMCVKSQSKYSANQIESKWKFSWHNPQTVAFNQLSV